MGDRPAFLVIEDNPADFRLIERHCTRQELDAHWHRVDRLGQLRDALEMRAWDLVLADCHVPGLEFTNSFAIIREMQPDLPVILISGHVGEERAVELLKLGVRDFIFKDNLTRLVPVIRNTLRDVDDVRARKRAEEMLLASERRFRALASNAPDVIWRFDPRGTILDISGAHEGVLGYGAGELIGDRLRRLIHPEDIDLLRDFTLLVKANTAGQSIVTRLRHKDGRYIWIESTTQALRDDGGQVVEMVSISRNITQRKEAEERLGLYRTMFHSTQEGIVVTDAHGNIIIVNPSFSKVTGYDEGELIGENPRILKSGVIAHPSRSRRERAGAVFSQPAV